MTIDVTRRTGDPNIDAYIEALEKENQSFNANNSRKLIRSIDAMAESISDNLNLIAKSQKNADGTEVELSSKNIDIYIKLVDKADKIKNFIEVAESFEVQPNAHTVQKGNPEKKRQVKNMFEEIQTELVK